MPKMGLSSIFSIPVPIDEMGRVIWKEVDLSCPRCGHETEMLYPLQGIRPPGDMRLYFIFQCPMCKVTDDFYLSLLAEDD